MFNNIKYVYKKYNFLLQQLVSRDFKVKYKRSVLGVLWSLLYPVLTMAVMALVFTNVFKFTTPDVNYLAYLMSGLVIFNYFSEASNLAMSSVVANFSLINKVYMPKYIFPLSKCVFVGINFLLSQIPLYVILIATGTGINIYHLLLPFAYICLFLFTLGFSLILAALVILGLLMAIAAPNIMSILNNQKNSPDPLHFCTHQTLSSPFPEDIPCDFYAMQDLFLFGAFF